MSEYAYDLKYDYTDYEDTTPSPVWIYAECDFEVRVLHRGTRECFWSGIITAPSKKAAQQRFRKDYSHIRSQFTHEYGLSIQKV